MRTNDPPYLRIADQLRQRVTDGEWEVGERLPSRATLGKELGVGPNVVQRAMELLISEGLLHGVAGSGTFVKARSPRHRMLRSHHTPPLYTDLRSVPPGTPTVDSTSDVKASEEIAARLGIDPGDLITRTSYDYLIDGKTMQVITSWEPQYLTRGTPIAFPTLGPLRHKSVVERMAAIGITVERAVERPRPALAGREYSVRLGTSASEPVTLIERTYYDVEGRAVETADFVVPDSRWEIYYELPVG
ncbi:GntR family transcriptional regulator [Kitasatospora sp. MMS16-BH015]|uniref:GntR family transcriptional regulator n=1 Tax=Kitasatospora sp. MMS16-BH015 TaxID=2018025 RepID=UPI000CA2DC62|nr:GntR family transcriptional regulator [Kitasatospora sp. MMS16-BH015]AUG79822.1 GntR family transcriptional regulator [Kitasatospora sp. MMS16-BH015]